MNTKADRSECECRAEMREHEVRSNSVLTRNACGEVRSNSVLGHGWGQAPVNCQ